MDFNIYNSKGNIILGPIIEFTPTFEIFLKDNLINYKYKSNVIFGDSVTFMDFGPNKHNHIIFDIIDLHCLSEKELKEILIKHFELRNEEKNDI